VIRVLIADDQELIRAGFRAIVETPPDMTVIGEAGDGQAALDAARSSTPDVVLMDIRMPGLDGISATEKVTALDPPPRVLVLTTFDHDDYVFGALKAGASGFLLKNAPRDQLFTAIRTVAAGEALLAPTVTRRIIEAYVATHRPSPPVPALDQLSAREKEVLTELARGQSNAEIGKQLYLSEATVKTHVASLLSKLRLRDRAQAIVYAYESGFTRVGTPPPSDRV
jgi:DNA-binding NarL/FixJ family response regulator